MYSLLLLVSIWVIRFCMFFSFISAVVKTNLKENKGKLPAPLKRDSKIICVNGNE